MKKKLLGIVLAICLAVLSVMPALAAGSDDPAVQASYNAFVAMQEAINDGDVDALEVAAADFENANEALSDEQQEELMELIGNDFWSVAYKSSCILSANDAYEAFVADPNTTTAMTFIEMYGYAVGAELAIDDMIPGIAAAYNEALELAPSEDVLTVYDALVNLLLYIEMPYSLEDFAAAIETYEDAMELYEDFSEEEIADLGELLGEEDAEAVDNVVKTTLETGKVVYDAAYAYDTFGMNWDKASAEAFIKTYESIILNDDIDDSIKDIIYGVYSDYDDLYDEAKALVAGEDASESPKTGEPVSMLVLAGVAAAGAAFAGKRRR